jgi:hypothetical protein
VIAYVHGNATGLQVRVERPHVRPDLHDDVVAAVIVQFVYAYDRLIGCLLRHAVAHGNDGARGGREDVGAEARVLLRSGCHRR